MSMFIEQIFGKLAGTIYEGIHHITIFIYAVMGPGWLNELGRWM